MSSPQRRRELAAIRAQEEEARLAEEARVHGLCIYDRIEEIKDISDVRAFLHLLMTKLDIDEWFT